MSDRPNIVLILNDDMGYSDIGCYGGEVQTPALDALAGRGLRFTQFFNTARCSPSRASLLTGLHPHQTGIGILTGDDRPDGYPGDLNRRCVTIAEVLGGAGYATYMSGKWHMSHEWIEVSESWPSQRGFQKFYGTIAGAGSYYDPNTLMRGNENIEHEAREGEFYYTDAISDNAAKFVNEHAAGNADRPFFMYVAYTAPHWPLHALEEDIAKYKGRFDAGWDKLREQRLERMVEMGIVDPSWKLTGRDPREKPWDQTEHKEWQASRMEVYAAQIDRMDQGIGRIVDALKANGQLDNTLVMFLSDNGGCAEGCGDSADGYAGAMIGRAITRDGRPVRYGNNPDVTPGPEDTYQSYAIPWANLSNTPFRLYKHWAHEGGIATPLIVHWPGRIEARGELRHQPGQLPDIMATVLEATGAEYPANYGGNEIPPCEGTSLVPCFDNEPNGRGMLFWEHEGNAAVRGGNWKLVRDYPGDWELYDMAADRTEMNDVAAGHPERVAAMKAAYETWAGRCGVIPRENVLEAWRRKHAARQEEKESDSE